MYLFTQSVARLTKEPEVLGSIPGPAIYFRSPSADSKRAVVSYWRNYLHEILVIRLGGLSLPKKKVVRITDYPDMTIQLFTVDVKQPHILQTALCFPCF